MKKTPPQSAVQERLVGSWCARRPMGPSRRPRKLHATTRRTAQHKARLTLHLEGGSALAVTREVGQKVRRNVRLVT